MNTKTKGIYRRCGCADPRTGRKLGDSCPKLAQSDHGTWYFTVQVTDRHGRRVRVRRGGYVTAEIAMKERDTIAQRDTSAPFDGGQTVAYWLRAWLENLPGQIRPSTIAGYTAHVEDHLIPALGHLKLGKLTVAHVQTMFTHLAGCKTRDGTPPTPATLQRIRATLRRALNIAVREQLIGTNPARFVVLPRPVRPRPILWSDNRISAWQASGWRPTVAVWTPALLARF